MSIIRLSIACMLPVLGIGSAVARNPSGEVVPAALEEAYKAQDERVAKRVDTTPGEGIAGFKGGLTNATAQKALGVSEPVYGVLYRLGSIAAAEDASLSSFGQLYIETEIGFVVGRRIVSKQRDQASLRKSIDAIVPVVELPDATRSAVSGSREPTVPAVADMVANNLGASRYVRGIAHPLRRLDPDTIAVKLHLDGVVINRGSGNEAIKGQWATLLSLVNRIVGRRGSIDPGTLIITGSLGTPKPGQVGRYRADYGELGAVEFNIVP